MELGASVICEPCPSSAVCAGVQEQNPNSPAAQLFAALVSLAQTQRRLHEDGFREESGESIIPVRNGRSPAALCFIPVQSSLEVVCCWRREEVVRGISQMLPLGKAWRKTVLVSVSPVQLRADAGMRLMPGRRGEGC